MHHAAGIRQLLHQRARPARMVEMDVGDEHPVNVAWLQAAGRERRHQVRHRVGGTGVDEGSPTAVHHQVAGVEPRPDVVGIDGGDAIGKVGEARLDVHRRRTLRI